MAHPKSKTSKRRKRARRTHFTAALPTLATCPTTGERHRFHHAYMVDGDLYYRGQVLVPGEMNAEEIEG
ncbi:MAG: 50S ribosomal protein L32 [Saprospiraceae bacterium]|jgi:large subunit ribosomal protein L32